MRYLRYASMLLTMGAAIFAGWQSYLIAAVGVNQQIPQLEGNGGGGLLFAALCLLAGATSVVRPKLAVGLYILSVAMVGLVSLIYQDDTMKWWALGICLLTMIHVTCWLLTNRWKTGAKKLGRSAQPSADRRVSNQ